MINLEQLKLLEAKVMKAADYVEKVTGENAALQKKETDLETRLEFHQQRIDELEALITRFKEEQDQIEDGILAALDRLSQFEDAIEKSLKEKPAGHAGGAKAAAKDQTRAQPPAMQAAVPSAMPGARKTQAQGATLMEAASMFNESDDSGSGKTCFEIPEGSAGTDIPDPLDDAMYGKQQGEKELEIF
ncbi:MAG: cell division protein ZapB [Treponema sp.]|nr:cell division protein ZapB [Treponema sp.]